MRAAVLREPASFALDDPEAARAMVTRAPRPRDADGLTAAFETFLRVVAGDATWDAAELRAHELRHARTLLR